jgi:hypothetical protein
MPAIDEHALIDEINNLLRLEYIPMPDELASLAGDYMQLCNDANTRLRQCAKLLRQGLRSEALQYCDNEPNLLELVSLLDFPDRQKWVALLRENNELLPPDLLIDVAGELNEAYAANLSLDGLMKKHRKLALARAPLSERIAILRRIAKADPANPVWPEDLRIYERTRVQAIGQELAAAVRDADLTTIESLDDEVTTAGWLEPPSATVIERVRQAHGRLRQEGARAEMKRLEAEFTAAHSEFDIERARSLRGRWQVCVALAGADSRDPLVEAVSPTIAWLDAEDANEQRQAGFAAAVAKLEHSLDSDVSLLDLERLVHDCLRFDMPLSPMLERRVRDRMASLTITNVRRRRLMVAGIAAGVLVAGALTAIGVREVMWRNEVSRQAAAIERLMQDGNTAGASEYLDKLRSTEPEIAASASVETIALQLASMIDDEAKRRQSFAASLDMVEKLADLEKPRLSGLSQANRHLHDETARLAKTATEKDKMSALQNRIAAAQRKEQGRIDEQFDERVHGLTDRLVKLEEAAKHDSASNEQAVAITRDVADLSAQSGLVSAHSSAALAPLKARADALARSITQRQEQDRLLRQVTGAVGDSGAFVSALGAYGNRFGQTGRAVDFKRVSQEASLWKQVERTTALARRWNSTKVDALSAAEAKALLDDSQQVAKDPLSASLPAMAAIQRRLPVLESITARGAKRTQIVRQLLDLLHEPTIADLRVVDIPDQDATRHYYVRETPKLDQATGKVVIKYVSGFDMKLKTRSARPEELTRKIAPYDDPAPQSELARQLLDLLDTKLDTLGWDETLSTMVERVRDNSTLDPILKLALIDRLTDIGSSSSIVLQKAFARTRELMSRAHVTLTVNWLNPEDTDSRSERSKALELLQRLPTGKEIHDNVRSQWAELNATVGPLYEWIGWLKHDDVVEDNEAWVCITAGNPSSSVGPLMVVLTDQAGNGQLKPVGKLQDGVAIVSPKDREALVEGRPVFVAVDGNSR